MVTVSRFRIHPFDIEHPAEYAFIDHPNIDADMQPFDSWQFCFDNGWAACIDDAHNDTEYAPRERWILDFSSWETLPNGHKHFYHARHPDIDFDLNLRYLTTSEVSRYLHQICRLPYRRFSARKVLTCYKCTKHFRRTDDVVFDDRARPYHFSCW